MDLQEKKPDLGKRTNINQNSLKDNPYQYTRGIRFRAHPNRQSKQFQEKYKLDNQGSDLSELVTLLLNFYGDLKKLLFYNKQAFHNGGVEKLVPKSYSKQESTSETTVMANVKSDKLEFRKKLSVNKTWLKQWHREIFYQWIKKDSVKQGKYALRDLKELYPSFLKWFEEWDKYRSQLEVASKSPKESQFRHSDIAWNIRGLLNRRQWDYINDFLTEVHTADSVLGKKIKKLKSDLKKVNDRLKVAEEIYLPSQSSGVEIAKASFNYYTVDKKSKEYYEKEPQKAKDQLYKEVFSTIKRNEKGVYEWLQNKDNFQNKTIFQFKSDQEKEWIKIYVKNQKQKLLEEDTKDKFEGDLETGIVALSLNQTYIAMKAFKAEQKSVFYEIISHIVSDKKKGGSFQVKNKNCILEGEIFSYEKLNMEGLKKEFLLFQFNSKRGETAEKFYDDFINLTKNLQAEQNPEKKTEIAKKRGQFLFGKDCYFREYGKFCETYKNIAQQRGRLIAQINGIEKEKREALQTDFWSFIYCNQDKKQLWLVLKENRKKARKFIYNTKGRQAYSQGDLQYLCCFESLTLRALHKLCFAEQSSFVNADDGMLEDRSVSQNIKDLYKEIKILKTKGTDKNRKKEKQEEKEKKTLQFFKKLLKTNYAREKLPVLNAFSPSFADTLHPLKKEAWQALDKAKTLLEFEKSLETACYYPKRIVFKAGEKDYFLETFDVTVLDISSYDLDGRNQNYPPGSENRLHTDLWKAFWNNMDKSNGETKVKDFYVGKIRLNPEVKICYRKEDENLKKYFEKRNFSSSFKHRRLQDQFTIHCTLALNAGKKYEDLAFAKSDEIFRKIDSFNKELNKSFETAWRYGIDRGQKELATLCLVRFDPDKNTYKENNNTIVQPEFKKIEECYTFQKKYDYIGEYQTKKGTIKKGQAIKNLSYFVHDKYLDKEEFFRKENTSCLDLTTAKVIKEKIITNGDVMTFLQLKKAVAKRRLYELYNAKKIEKNTVLEWSKWENGKTSNDEKSKERERPEGVLNIKTSQGQEETIYWYVKKYENILINSQKNIKYNKESIKNTLNHYLNELKEENKKHTPTILKINHLRDAITANMVGVICHLQKKCKGFIPIEDLKRDTVDWHFFRHNENISRRLENALYNKFQSFGLVPPHVKNIIQLREDLRDKQKELKKSKPNHIICSQIGTIVFVEEEDTSWNCPYCEEKNNRKNKKVEKFKQHRFICDSCGFDTYYFKTEKKRTAKYTPEVNTDNCKGKFELFRDINDPDKVAAYNVAKKIIRSEQIGKWSS